MYKASGIDQVTKDAYAENLMGNLDDLIERLHRMAYIPQPVLRVYIPKSGSDKMRPLGIPALEDKLVQAGLSKILQAIYEQDFIEDSYGFRPNRGCHDALRTLNQTIEQKGTEYVVEADIKGVLAIPRYVSFKETARAVSCMASGHFPCSPLNIAGGCVKTLGGTNYVKIPGSGLDLSNEGTLEAWIYIYSFAPYAGIIHKGNKRNWSDEAYTLQFYRSRRIRLAIFGEHGNSDLNTNTVFEARKCYHVIATWNADGMRIYINGKLDNSTSKTTVVRSTPGDVQIGAQLDENYNSTYKNFPFDGTIGASIFDKALTPEEITACN